MARSQSTPKLAGGQLRPRCFPPLPHSCPLVCVVPPPSLFGVPPRTTAQACRLTVSDHPKQNRPTSRLFPQFSPLDKFRHHQNTTTTSTIRPTSRSPPSPANSPSPPLSRSSFSFSSLSLVSSSAFRTHAAPLPYARLEPQPPRSAASPSSAPLSRPVVGSFRSLPASFVSLPSRALRPNPGSSPLPAGLV